MEGKPIRSASGLSRKRKGVHSDTRPTEVLGGSSAESIRRIELARDGEGDVGADEVPLYVFSQDTPGDEGLGESVQFTQTGSPDHKRGRVQDTNNFEDEDDQFFASLDMDQMQSDQPAASAATTNKSPQGISSGGIVDANIGVERPLALPTSKHYASRRMRFAFYNVAESAWSQSTDKKTLLLKSNFFEIPHNHMNFYMPSTLSASVFRGDLCTKFRILNCGWKLYNIRAKTFNEVDPSKTDPVMNLAGAITPTLEILNDAERQPTYRGRIWGTDVSGDTGIPYEIKLRINL